MDRFNGGDTLIDASTSNHTHRWISLARLGESIPVAVGGSSSLKVEALEGDSWRDLDDYPFAESYFYLYSTVTFNNDLYIFGKMSNHYIMLNQLETFIQAGRLTGKQQIWW